MTTFLARRRFLIQCATTSAIASVPLLSTAAQGAFDHQHASWNALLRAYAVLAASGNASAVRYAGMQRDREALVEHGLIRAPGGFDDPRIHAAVVSASAGCPMLRNEAFVAERLDAQLDDGLRRFLSDRTRNRFDASAGTLLVSKLFD